MRQVLAGLGAAALAASAGAVELEYAPAPLDNPLKGLVPYVSASETERFPHSMEFRYFPLKSLMKGPAIAQSCGRSTFCQALSSKPACT